MVTKRRSGAIRQLTTREQQVLQLMADGMTSKESGRRLGINCYLESRIRDRRLRFFLHGLAWVAVMSAVLLIVLNGWT